ncbi:3'-5' exonuclease [Vibrio sp. S11_S32]|uniref:3'-5' exonuclease n=1 Tax=Vibrio sp. S11_S32 TaxID=2720225 RepID=UPI0031455C1D
MPDQIEKHPSRFTSKGKLGNMMNLFSNRHPLLRLEKRRQTLLQQVQEHSQQPLPQYLQRLLVQPYPNPKQDCKDLSFTVVDFETSGLDPSSDHIVSIGWVHIIKGVIKLSTAQHFIVNQPVASAATKENETDNIARSLHHILPEQQKMGISIEQAMQHFFESLPSSLVIAHGTTIETRFLSQFFLSHNLIDLPLIWLDTLKIEQATILNNRYQNDFRLSALRRFYKLPDYPAHNALMDATATAELFLAQKRRLFGQAIAPIGILYQKSQ